MRRMGLLSITCAAALAVACSDGSRNNTVNDIGQSTVGTSGESAVSSADRDFVEDVAVANMAEIELGQMASTRGQSADVKQFGQMMVKDHTMAGNELMQAISGRDIPIPQALDDEHQELKNKLMGLSGAEFDREYMSAMVDGHEDVADTLESRVETNDVATGTSGSSEAETYTPEASDNPTTMAINQWAARTLPTVKHHLDEAMRISDRLENRRNTTN